jgi:hypothetical protein
MTSFQRGRQLLSSTEIARLKDKGVLQEAEYAFVDGDVVFAENVKTQDKRVLGKASDLLVEGGSKRVLKG